MTNYVNLFITTNEDLGAVALDAADRRFVCYRASAHRKHDAAYFDRCMLAWTKPTRGAWSMTS